MGTGMLKMLLPDLDVDGVMNNINIALLTVREIKEALIRIESNQNILEDRINDIYERSLDIGLFEDLKNLLHNQNQWKLGLYSKHSVPEGIAPEGIAIARNQNLKPME
jgi:hypothetical protein